MLLKIATIHTSEMIHGRIELDTDMNSNWSIVVIEKQLSQPKIIEIFKQ